MAAEEQRYRLDDLVKEYGDSADPKVRALVTLAVHGARLLVALERFALDLNTINAQTAPDVNKYPAIITDVHDTPNHDAGGSAGAGKPAKSK